MLFLYHLRVVFDGRFIVQECWPLESIGCFRDYNMSKDLVFQRGKTKHQYINQNKLDNQTRFKALKGKCIEIPLHRTSFAQSNCYIYLCFIARNKKNNQKTNSGWSPNHFLLTSFSITNVAPQVLAPGCTIFILSVFSRNKLSVQFVLGLHVGNLHGGISSWASCVITWLKHLFCTCGISWLPHQLSHVPNLVCIPWVSILSLCESLGWKITCTYTFEIWADKKVIDLESKVKLKRK